MTIPLNPRIMDAICMDHVVPTTGGLHIRRDGMMALTDDPLLVEAFDLVAPSGYAYVTLGKGMTEAFDDLAPAATAFDGDVRTAGQAGSHAQRVARNLLYQFLNGHPGYALDRLVERPLGDHGLNLAGVAARADAAGLPVDVRGPFDFAGVDPQRLIGFSSDLRIVPIAQADLIRVVPYRHWTPDPYRDMGADLIDGVLAQSYPSERIVFDGAGGVLLGLPAALAERAYGTAFRGFRPLDPIDMRATTPQILTRYGDLLAAMAATPRGTHALVQVGEQVSLAIHDGHGISFVNPDPAVSGVSTVFPAAPGEIRLSVLDGAMQLDERLLGLDAVRPEPAGPRFDVRHSGAASLHHDFGKGRTLDLIGVAPGPFMDRVEKAAAGLDQSVIVIGAERQSDAPTPAELAALDWQLHQHRTNRRLPVVITRGPATEDLRRITAFYKVPLLFQTAGTGGFSLDNLWAGVGGATALPPAKEITADLLQAYAGRNRVSDLPAVPDDLARLLATPLEDTDAILTEVRRPESSLRGLRDRIGEFGATKDLFAAHAGFLNLLDNDASLAERMLAYRGGGADRAGMFFAAMPAVVAKEPAARAAAVADIEAITRGTLDDGAMRAIMKALHLHMEGADTRVVMDMIHSHNMYLPKSGRATIIRHLQELQPKMPEQADGLNQIALYVTTCP
ncbi:hypothetical protein ACIA8K_03670 [Catenuloplanes sp. NPDC051500]|uniref:hypothetical protein n=1 Tax=Catenuloplanes sp. NPDC051500 TaxID=3363959 RepID=UPI0037B27E0D